MCLVRWCDRVLFFHISNKKKVFLQHVCACDRQGHWTGKIFIRTFGNNKFFLQCVFACAWSSWWTGKLLFHTPGNKSFFLHCAFACAWSSGRNGKIFFHTPRNQKVFPRMFLHVPGQVVEIRKSFLTLLTTIRIFSNGVVWFNHRFLQLKSRNSTNGARGNMITSKITSWLYGDDKI